jgi:oligopeptide/dipeptide ABC transporter ATP-binding protein
MNFMQNPLHPYTKALLSAIPLPDPQAENVSELSCKEILPLPSILLLDVLFAPRCPKKKSALCETKMPQLIEISKDHWVTDLPL